MLRLVVAVVVVSGCAASGLPADDPETVLPQVSPATAQCVWHFTDPSDTSDSDETPGVANCDSSSFNLDDGVLDIVVQRDGIATFGGAEILMRAGGSNAVAWCADLIGATVHGMICANLR